MPILIILFRKKKSKKRTIQNEKNPKIITNSNKTNKKLRILFYGKKSIIENGDQQNK